MDVSTREKMIRSAVSDAVSKAFGADSQRRSDDTARPTLNSEDCEDIAALAFRTAANVALGKFGVRTMHGGSF